MNCPYQNVSSHAAILCGYCNPRPPTNTAITNGSNYVAQLLSCESVEKHLTSCDLYPISHPVSQSTWEKWEKKFDERFPDDEAFRHYFRYDFKKFIREVVVSTVRETEEQLRDRLLKRASLEKHDIILSWLMDEFVILGSQHPSQHHSRT